MPHAQDKNVVSGELFPVDKTEKESGITGNINPEVGSYTNS